jgi:ferric-dicitrate binding protein FerR (iron transport regulator)
MNKKVKNTDKDWGKLASLFSGETNKFSGELGRFRETNYYGIEKYWNEMGKMEIDKKIDLDKAWNSIYSRFEENGLLTETVRIENRFNIRAFLRIAAAALVLIGLGSTFFYLNKAGAFSVKIVIAANSNERNKEVSLPDGSKIFLNRNSKLSYNKNMGGKSREVTLNGEAFFDIKHDPANPFIIDAGKATIKVLGTSFSVLTNNSNNAVEVFVKTGSVLLADNSGRQNLVLEPGFIGTMDSKSYAKSVNENPNYLSWNTDVLDYTGGRKLDIVFSDLKKVFNIDVVADKPEILNEEISTIFYKQPQDSIIQVICATFNFSYRKEGSIYHLSKR